ncbi:hypothetical protein ES704_03650 [subsurface metagenome]|jgi:MinD superfamily P-loop ATPase
MKQTRMRHTWINYPTSTKQKCTRCGLMKEICRSGNYGTIYYLNNKKLEKRPECK